MYVRVFIPLIGSHDGLTSRDWWVSSLFGAPRTPSRRHPDQMPNHLKNSPTLPVPELSCSSARNSKLCRSRWRLECETQSRGLLLTVISLYHDDLEKHIGKPKRTSDGDLAPTWATYPLQPQYKHFQLCLIIVAIRVLQVLKQLFRWISHVATLISIVMRSHVDFSFLRLEQLRLLINNPTVWIESDRSFRRLWAKPSVLRRNVFDRIQDVTIHPIHFPQETGILYHNEVDELISMMRTYSVRTPQDNWLFVGGHSLLHHGSLRMLRTPSWKMGSI